MKKLALFLIAAPFAFLFACDDGSNVVPCTEDADCADSGLDDPICDATLEICVSDLRECEENVECQVTDIGASAVCTENADCDAGDVCVPGASGDAHCVTEGGNCPDGFEEATADDIDGNDVTFCVDAAVSCNADGDCEG